MFPYVEHFLIRQYEVDKNSQLRVQTLCNFMEEVADKHATQLGVGLSDLAPQGLSWAMTKMRLLFNFFPEAGVTVKIATWPCGIDHFFFPS